MNSTLYSSIFPNSDSPISLKPISSLALYNLPMALDGPPWMQDSLDIDPPLKELSIYKGRQLHT